MAVLVKKDEMINAPDYTQSFAIVQHNGRIMIVPDINLKQNTFSSSSSLTSTVIDRKLVSPGETLHVKGELMSTVEASDSMPINLLSLYLHFYPETNLLETSRAGDRLHFSINALVRKSECDDTSKTGFPCVSWQCSFMHFGARHHQWKCK